MEGSRGVRVRARGVRAISRGRWNWKERPATANRGVGRHRARASDVARVIRVETREVDRDPRNGDARDDRVLPRRAAPESARPLCASPSVPGIFFVFFYLCAGFF